MAWTAPPTAVTGAQMLASWAAQVAEDVGWWLDPHYAGQAGDWCIGYDESDLPADPSHLVVWTPQAENRLATVNPTNAHFPYISDGEYAMFRAVRESEAPSTIALGTICWFYGDPANLPEGWYVCNGDFYVTMWVPNPISGGWDAVWANRPDYRDRLVVGAGSTYSVGSTRETWADLGHSHQVTVASESSHGHWFGNTETKMSEASDHNISATTGAWPQVATDEHAHAVKFYFGNGSHAHPGSTTTMYTTGTKADYRPPYHSLYLIIRDVPSAPEPA